MTIELVDKLVDIEELVLVSVVVQRAVSSVAKVAALDFETGNRRINASKQNPNIFIGMIYLR